MTITSEGLTNFLTRSNCSIIAYLRLLSDILKANFQLLRERYISFNPFFKAKNRPKILEYTNLFKNVLVYFQKRLRNKNILYGRAAAKEQRGKQTWFIECIYVWLRYREETAIADKTRSIEQLLNYFQKTVDKEGAVVYNNNWTDVQLFARTSRQLIRW